MPTIPITFFSRTGACFFPTIFYWLFANYFISQFIVHKISPTLRRIFSNQYFLILLCIFSLNYIYIIFCVHLLPIHRSIANNERDKRLFSHLIVIRTHGLPAYNLISSLLSFISVTFIHFTHMLLLSTPCFYIIMFWS